MGMILRYWGADEYFLIGTFNEAGWKELDLIMEKSRLVE